MMQETKKFPEPRNLLEMVTMCWEGLNYFLETFQNEELQAAKSPELEWPWFCRCRSRLLLLRHTLCCGGGIGKLPIFQEN